ncbi:MAG: Crp/Fnr family transcriptional regulator [Anaerolineales bacterium]|nr:Crp/Fnr family transcriptional regulator [Anaerolineales bacterium]
MTTQSEIISELEKIPWFRELKPEHFQRMAAIATLRRVKAGETLFYEGDKEDYLYIVMEGRVALEMFVPHRGKMRFYTAEEMDVIGWSSVTPVVHQRTAGAIAVMDGRVVALDADKLRQICDEEHDLGYLVMRRLANIIAGRLMVTRLQLIDMFAQPDKECGDD